MDNPYKAYTGIKAGLWPFKLEAALMDGDVSTVATVLGRVRTTLGDAPPKDSAEHALLKQACNWLRSKGRRVNLADPNPRMWIEAANGGPRRI